MHSARKPLSRRPPQNPRAAHRPLPQGAPQPVAAIASPSKSAEEAAAPAPMPAQREERALALRCVAGPMDFEGIESTRMFDTLGKVRAISVAESEGAPDGTSPIYTREELFALAEMGYHYLQCGGHRLAEVIFEGLAALEPREAYFAMAMGLVADRMEQPARARKWYERARQLDPTDPRADINLAELELADGRRSSAVARLQSAQRKANARRDQALADKASAILSLLGND